MPADDYYGDATITNGASGLRVIQNTQYDWSVKIISGDGTKNVTVVRYQGRTAQFAAELAYTLIMSVLRVLRLDV
jgi:hypothetical protein